jgi:hypothetical protein
LHGLSDVDVHKRAAPLPIAERMRYSLSKKKSFRDIYEEAQLRRSS